MRHGAIEPSLEYLADRGNRVIPAMSAFGTKRTYQHDLLIVRFRGEADLHGPLALPASVVNDP